MTEEKTKDISANMKKVFVKSAITLWIIFILLIIGSINAKKISKLSIINMNAFIVMGAVFCFVSLIFLLYSLYALISKFKNSDLSNKLENVNYKVYSVHDLLNFIFLVVFIIFFALAFILTPTTVSGSSMNSTLYNDDKLLIWHLNYKPKVDDIVVVDINEHYHKNIDYTSIDAINNEEFYIKRIVATSKDVIKYESETNNPYYGELYLNSSKEAFAQVSLGQFQKMSSTIMPLISYFDSNTNTLTVPDGYSVVMGDNRNNSVDSRYIGLIHNEDIMGKAVFRYFSKNGSFGKIKKNILE